MSGRGGAPGPRRPILSERCAMIAGVDNDSIVYLNGQYVRLGDARISVLDRGFIFGDGIYDVVPAYAGRPFRMDEHLARLERSLASIQITVDKTRADWEQLVTDMLQRSGLQNCIVYIQVTRDLALPRVLPPRYFAWFRHSSALTRPLATRALVRCPSRICAGCAARSNRSPCWVMCWPSRPPSRPALTKSCSFAT